MEILKGTLDMLVLRTLVFGPQHGYGIARAMRDMSGQSLEIEFGSLYPSLQRLETKGWVASKWETSDTNRRAKYYRLTAAGRKQLHQEQSKWAEFTSAVARILRASPESRHRPRAAQGNDV